MFTINNHTVSTYYAGITVYVIDEKDYFGVTQASNACGVSPEIFNEICWKNR